MKDDAEIKNLLIKAKSEISNLRRENEIYAAQAEVVSVFAAALGLKQQQQRMTIDICWEIDKKIASMEPKEVLREA